jgi:hypothetical protein
LITRNVLALQRSNRCHTAIIIALADPNTAVAGTGNRLHHKLRRRSKAVASALSGLPSNAFRNRSGVATADEPEIIVSRQQHERGA